MSKQKESAPQAVKIEARAYPLAEPRGSIVANASVTIADLVGIHNIRVIKGEKGLFASMPQAKDRNGEYKDIAHPVTGELRKQLNAAVIDAYNEALEKGAQEKPSVKDQIKAGQTAAKDTPAPNKEKAAKKSGPEH